MKQLTNFPALLFRHDLDEISGNQFARLMEIESETGANHTNFVLAHQAVNGEQVVFPKGMPDCERVTHEHDYRCFVTRQGREESIGFAEFALHSEAKPERWTPETIFLEYVAKLGWNKERVESVLGRLEGHSAHSDNGAMFINIHGINEEAIEKDASILVEASRKAEFRWFSCTKALSYFRADALEFLPVQPPFMVEETLVLPIAWDDYLAYNMDRLLGEVNEERLIASLEKSLEECLEKGIPCVVSMHPMRFIHEHSRYLYDPRVVRHTAEYARKLGMPSLTFTEYAKRALQKEA